MKAAVFRGAGQELRIEDWPIPEPGPGEILVAVAACGVCHTDLHYLDHGVTTFKAPPVVLGHEASGVVARCGDGVTAFVTGDRVLVPAVFSCGTCAACRAGRENICRSQVMLGNHIDGAYAEYVRVPAKDVCRLPPEIPLVEGAIIADAVSTPFHAVTRRARVRPGDTVAVFGCGGVGLNAVQIAALSGGIVLAIDKSAARLEWARRLGASETLCAGEQDVRREVRRLTGGGADVAIEAIGNPDVMALAFEVLRPGGRLCVIGYCDGALALPAGKLMFREIEVVGSLGCRPGDYPRLVELVRLGRIQVAPLVTHRFALADLGEALDVLRRGEGVRAVVLPGGTPDAGAPAERDARAPAAS